MVRVTAEFWVYAERCSTDEQQEAAAFLKANDLCKEIYKVRFGEEPKRYDLTLRNRTLVVGCQMNPMQGKSAMQYNFDVEYYPSEE